MQVVDAIENPDQKADAEEIFLALGMDPASILAQVEAGNAPAVVKKVKKKLASW